MNRLAILIFWIGALASLAAAASAPTFCKCTCFSNSTIIEIKSKSVGTGSSSSSHLKEEGSTSPSDSDSDSNSNSDHDDDNKDKETPALSSTPSVATPDLSDGDNKEVPTAEEDTIAAADDQAANTSPLPDSPENLFFRTRKRSGRRAQTISPSCNQCNRAFCLSQSLPICKGATEKDVVTMCFQRDSRKDQIVVWGFILGTAGLLGYAALRKMMEVQETGQVLALIAAKFGVGEGRRRGVGNMGIGRSERGGAGGSGGSGALGGLGVGLGIGRSNNDGRRGQYASVPVHSRQNSVAPLMGEHE